MEVFVLLGVAYCEGTDLLGVYHTQADAESARDANRDRLAADHSRYDDYDIQRRVIGASARANWEK